MTASRRDRRRQRGVVLLLVLWVFMTLGVLALDFSQYMRDDAMAAVNLADETRGYYTALAGMNLAIFEASQERAEAQQRGGAPAPPNPNEDKDGDGKPDGQPQFIADAKWHDGHFADGDFRVRLQGEDGRVPLNASIDAPDKEDIFRTVIHQVVTNVVLLHGNRESVNRDEQAAIDEITDSILDWRDCDRNARTNGAEDDYYLGLDRPHRAKNGYFDSVEELLQVRGVTPDLYYPANGGPGFRDVFSVFPKGGDWTINSAQLTPEVVTALLPGMGNVDARQLLEANETDQGQDLATFVRQQLDLVYPGLSQRVTSVPPEVIRVEACGGDLKGAKRNIGAVIAVVQLNASDFEGPRVLSWIDRPATRCEDVDTTGPTTTLKPASGARS